MELKDEFFKYVSKNYKDIAFTDRNDTLFPDVETGYSFVKIVYNNGNIVRVLPVDNNYSVDELGNIDNTAKKSSIKIIKKESSYFSSRTRKDTRSYRSNSTKLGKWHL